MSKWAEYTFRWDDAPLDISPLFADEVPAGKYGFIKNNNGQFEFENGKTARFWGVLINSAACFPEHHEADKVARRLAKFGINIGTEFCNLVVKFGVFRFESIDCGIDSC